MFCNYSFYSPYSCLAFLYFCALLHTLPCIYSVDHSQFGVFSIFCFTSEYQMHKMVILVIYVWAGTVWQSVFVPSVQVKSLKQIYLLFSLFPIARCWYSAITHIRNPRFFFFNWFILQSCLCDRHFPLMIIVKCFECFCCWWFCCWIGFFVLFCGFFLLFLFFSYRHMLTGPEGNWISCFQKTVSLAKWERKVTYPLSVWYQKSYMLIMNCSFCMCLYEILVNDPWRKSYWSPDWYAIFDFRFATNVEPLLFLYIGRVFF